MTERSARSRTLPAVQREGCYPLIKFPPYRPTSECPVIRPESMPSAEITFYKPTARYLSRLVTYDGFEQAEALASSTPAKDCVIPHESTRPISSVGDR